MHYNILNVPKMELFSNFAKSKANLFKHKQYFFVNNIVTEIISEKELTKYVRQNSFNSCNYWCA